VVSTHVWFWYVRQQPVEPRTYWWLIPKLDTLPVGQIVAWDNHYSDRWGLHRADLLSDSSHWRPLHAFGGDTSAIVFERYR
jgi:hypothetical protein